MKIHNISDLNFTDGIRVFISGVTGQDGSHMADYLLKKHDNINIIGGARRLSVDNHTNIIHLDSDARFQLVNFDLTDTHSICNLVQHVQPDYFINFAAQSFVASSWDFARQTWQTNSTGVLDCLEAIRKHKPDCRFYNAGSSEEFGDVIYSPQDEKHPLRPRSPYGASKAAARQLVKVYRESYDLYAIQGWLLNHEGTRRGEEFVTRKITKAVARIKKAMLKGEPFESLELGNIDAQRDWSDAEDMVDAVWRMLNQEEYNPKLKKIMHECYMGLYPALTHTPGDYNDMRCREYSKLIRNQIKEYVVASDETHSIREFVELAFASAGISGVWTHSANPLNEQFVAVRDLVNTFSLENPVVLVKINPKFYRPAEVTNLLGNSHAIRTELEWSPVTKFQNLVTKMVWNDMKIQNVVQCIKKY